MGRIDLFGEKIMDISLIMKCEGDPVYYPMIPNVGSNLVQVIIIYHNNLLLIIIKCNG